MISCIFYLFLFECVLLYYYRHSKQKLTHFPSLFHLIFFILVFTVAATVTLLISNSKICICIWFTTQVYWHRTLTVAVLWNTSKEFCGEYFSYSPLHWAMSSEQYRASATRLRHITCAVNWVWHALAVLYQYTRVCIHFIYIKWQNCMLCT